MAINFPNSPIDGQVYTLGSRSWTWSNTGGFWQASSTTVGYTGSQGVGYTGSQGTTGYDGSVGYTGSRGIDGVIGYDGSVGFTGSIGYTGSQGSQGTTGFVGSAGYNGSVGFTGSAGSQGTTGFVGSAGYNGSVGFTGSIGFTGSTGYTGSAGIRTTANATSQYFTANGTQNTFTLSTSVASQNNLLVSLDGSITVPSLHYSINGTSLTFIESPIANSIVEVRNLEYGAGGGGTSEQALIIAVSDESTAITTGTAKVTMRAPFAMTLSKIPKATLSNVSSSGVVTVDINETGTSILGANKLTIDANELTSTTAANSTSLADTSIADDAELTIDIDTAGTGAKGLKVYLYYTR